MKKSLMFSIIFLSLVGTNCNAEIKTNFTIGEGLPEKNIIGSVIKESHCIEFYNYKGSNQIRKEIFFKNGKKSDFIFLENITFSDKDKLIQEISTIVNLYNDTNITIKDIDSNMICYHRIKGDY